MTIDPRPDVDVSGVEDDAGEEASRHAHVVATPAPGVEFLGAAAQEGRYLARREDGRVVRMPWPLYRVATLLDGTRDLAAVAAEIGAEEDRACSVEEVRLVVERRLVPAGLVLPLPDDGAPAEQDVPAHGTGTDTGEGGGARGAPRRVLPVAALLLAALVLVVGTAAVTALVVSPADSAQVVPAAAPDGAAPDGAASDGVAPDGAAPVTAPGGITGPPTLLGRVVEVADARSVVVDVGGRRLLVDVAGLAAGGTPPCAAADARAFAEETLQGQEVTLVPDPTLAPPPPGRWQAYLVLGSQLSYTDAALRAGWATAGDGRYRSGFVDGQRAAEQAGAGQFGPPCRSS